MSPTELIDHLVAELPVPERTPFKEQYESLLALPGSSADFSEFLAAFVRGVGELYAATAAAVWFRKPSGDGLDRKADVGYESLLLDGELAAAHEQLLKFALGGKHPLIVKPFSSPAAGARVSNPTDSFVLLGPVTHHGDEIAVIELFLGPTPLRGQTTRLRHAYVEWLAHLISILCDGIERRFLASGKPLEAALLHLDYAASQVLRYQEAIRRSIEASLHSLVGQNFGTVAANQAVAKRVHELLDGMGLRVKCPECGAPAILRCQGTGNSKTGVFLFDHYLDSGRTFHGGPTTFPLLTVVPKPPRRRKK